MFTFIEGDSISLMPLNMEHLNLYLEGTSQIFEFQDEDGNIREEHENLGSIVVRGDNVIFVNLANED